MTSEHANKSHVMAEYEFNIIDWYKFEIIVKQKGRNYKEAREAVLEKVKQGKC